MNSTCDNYASSSHSGKISQTEAEAGVLSSHGNLSPPALDRIHTSSNKGCRHYLGFTCNG
jgi:hypothetical protein